MSKFEVWNSTVGKGRKPNEAEAWFKARDRNADNFLDEAEYTASSVPNAPKF